MYYTDKNDLEIYYETKGEGDTVVLLHHGFASTAMWNGILPGLIAKGYRVVVYDRRGFGRSETGTDFEAFYTDGRYRPDSVDELECLRQILNVDAFHLVGQCEGGVVALDYAARYPQHTIDAVVSSTLCCGRIRMEEFNKAAFPKSFKDKNPKYKEKFIQWHGRENAETHYNMFRTYGGAYGRDVFDIRPDLPTVGCPVLILYPDRSVLFEVEQAVEFYRHLPQGELAVLPDCGHNTYEQQPEEYTRHVLNFLDSKRPMA